MRALPSLADAEWLRRPETQAVFAALSRAGIEARAVGGVVRNALMGLPVTDIDIATPATPDEVMEACRRAGLVTVPTGIDHGTVTVIVDRHPFEVTSLRRDVATDGRRATVAFTNDWAEDASRRDFTINALYCDAEGRIHDPLGGAGDINHRRIRFIGDPDRRIAEDYLRILRFFRFFATFGRGQPDADAVAACIRGRDGLARLSAERIRSEIMKLLVARRATDAIAAMTGAGLLVPVLHVAPRPGMLARLVAAEAALGLPPDACLRLSALALATKQDVPALAERLRLSGSEVHALRPFDSRWVDEMARLDDRAARRRLVEIGNAEWRARLVAAMAMGLAPDVAARWLAVAVAWTAPEFPIRGADLIASGMAPGPRVGDLLKALRQWWLDTDFPSEAAARAELAARLAGK